MLIKVGSSGSVVRTLHSLSRGPRFQYSSKWVVVAQWLERCTLCREDQGSNTHQKWVVVAQWLERHTPSRVDRGSNTHQKWVVVAQWLERHTLSRVDQGSNTHQSGS